MVKVAGRLKKPVTQLAPVGLKQACTGATAVAILQPDRQTFGVLEVRTEQMDIECIMWRQASRTADQFPCGDSQGNLHKCAEQARKGGEPDFFFGGSAPAIARPSL
ncbi:hypothetical protein [Limnobacter sp.]|uniref:hypothetical protein n=1 Tax=Limnobacter sp. TaxID=2003368 RepID=UPI00258D4B76|nr:hypothetical protein [Limnobacter sp.]